MGTAWGSLGTPGRDLGGTWGHLRTAGDTWDTFGGHVEFAWAHLGTDGHTLGTHLVTPEVHLGHLRGGDTPGHSWDAPGDTWKTPGTHLSQVRAGGRGLGRVVPASLGARESFIADRAARMSRHATAIEAGGKGKDGAWASRPPGGARRAAAR